MKNTAKAILGYGLALAALVWVFHDVDWRVAAGLLGTARYPWIVAAVVCDVLSYCCEAERWRLLLHPVGRLPFLRAAQAIYAGLFTNEVTPLRLGEVVRAYLASRWMGRPVASLIPSMLVGRLIDGVWLAAGGALLLVWLPLPASIEEAGEIFAMGIGVLLAVFVTLVVRTPQWVREWVRLPGSRIRAFLGGLLEGIGNIGMGRELGLAAGFSLLLMLAQAAAFWCVMEACHLPLGYAQAAAVFLIVHLGTAVPNAPANVGSFQFFTVLGLQLFGVDKSTAAGFSVLVFVVLTLPLWALGLLAVSRSGVTLDQIRARQEAKPAEPEPPPRYVRFPRMERKWSDPIL